MPFPNKIMLILGLAISYFMYLDIILNKAITENSIQWIQFTSKPVKNYTQTTLAATSSVKLFHLFLMCINQEATSIVTSL